MASSKSRYIPIEIKRQLSKLFRDRCCLCKKLIDPYTYHPNDLSDFLEKHHLIFFSDGGDHSIENLLLLCRICHAKVHADSKDFSITTLKKHKSNWIRLASIIKSDTEAESVSDSNAAFRLNSSEDWTYVLFSVESLNLHYTFWIPSHGTVSIGQLSEAALDKVVKPLGKAIENIQWQQADSMNLALRSEPNRVLSKTEPVLLYRRLNDPFIGLILAQTVCCPSDIDFILTLIEELELGIGYSPKDLEKIIQLLRFLKANIVYLDPLSKLHASYLIDSTTVALRRFSIHKFHQTSHFTATLIKKLHLIRKCFSDNS